MTPGLPGEVTGDVPEGPGPTDQGSVREVTIADLFKDQLRPWMLSA